MSSVAAYNDYIIVVVKHLEELGDCLGGRALLKFVLEEVVLKLLEHLAFGEDVEKEDED